jgi:hypothetical protein
MIYVGLKLGVLLLTAWAWGGWNEHAVAEEEIWVEVGGNNRTLKKM